MVDTLGIVPLSGQVPQEYPLSTHFEVATKNSTDKNVANDQQNFVRLGTSGESAKESQILAGRLRNRILDLARRVGTRGLTISEAERFVDDHKGHSVSPRFAELVRAGALVRIPIEPGRSTRRFPGGIPRYISRRDEQTGREVNVHWLPEFAPVSKHSTIDSGARRE